MTFLKRILRIVRQEIWFEKYHKRIHTNHEGLQKNPEKSRTMSDNEISVEVRNGGQWAQILLFAETNLLWCLSNSILRLFWLVKLRDTVAAPIKPNFLRNWHQLPLQTSSWVQILMKLERISSQNLSPALMVHHISLCMRQLLSFSNPLCF